MVVVQKEKRVSHYRKFMNKLESKMLMGLIGLMTNVKTIDLLIINGLLLIMMVLRA